MSAAKEPYAVGEVVLALDKGQYFEAKILKEQVLGDDHRYFIHYQGWARKYDTWVTEAALARKNDVSALIATIAGNTNRKAIADNVESESVPATMESTDAVGHIKTEPGMELSVMNASAPKRKSYERDETMRQIKKNRTVLSQSDLIEEDDEEQAALSRMQIPMALKKHLVDEWNLITQDTPKRLVQLPRHVTADKIFRDFLDLKRSKVSGDNYSKYKELFEGLQIYFDKALPALLLYRQEREQYNKILEAIPNLSPSAVYGGEHLLRLFVRLPKLLATVVLEPGEITQVQARLVEFVKFVHKHSDNYIDIGDYIPASEGLKFVGHSELCST